MSVAPRVIVMLSVVLAAAAAALHELPREAQARAVHSQPSSTARCALRGIEARTHAQALEHRAMLHGERAPFRAHEGLRATELFAEAEACYRAAGDRSGLSRAASQQRRYQVERARRERIATLADGGEP